MIQQSVVSAVKYPVGEEGDGNDCMDRKQCRCMLTVIMVVVPLCFVAYLLFKPQPIETFQLTILHTNDVHVRLEQFGARSGACEGEGK